MKQVFVLAMTVLVASCASSTVGNRCALDDSQLEVLKPRALKFLASKWQPEVVACEAISDFTLHVRKFGCGILGGPTGSSRPGCPDALDGDYFVIFDPDTLQPSEVVEVAY